MIFWALLGVQLVSYGALGAWFLTQGNYKLAIAQGLLAVVQGLVFS